MKVKVNQYDNENNYMFTYNSITHAAKLTGISRASITKCCKGTQKTAGGWIWRYAFITCDKCLYGRNLGGFDYGCRSEKRRAAGEIMVHNIKKSRIVASTPKRLIYN